MDWILSEDGFAALKYGIPDTDWTADADGRVTFTWGKNADGVDYTSLNAKYPIAGLSMLGSWSGYRSYMDQSLSADLLATCDE
ncbi:MAG: hypothetical protein ACOYJR_05595 [Acutalibacteraceae bacterium]|jgi:hypothetical protein